MRNGENRHSLYVIKTVECAIENNGCPAIINSDQGSQFTSSEYKRVIEGTSHSAKHGREVALGS